MIYTYIQSSKLNSFFKSKTQISTKNSKEDKSLFVCPLPIKNMNLSVQDLCRYVEDVVPKYPILYIKNNYDPTLDLNDFLRILALTLSFLKQSIVNWDMTLLYVDSLNHLSPTYQIPYPRRPYYYRFPISSPIYNNPHLFDVCLISPQGRQKLLSTSPSQLVIIAPAINLLIPSQPPPIIESYLSINFIWFILFMILVIVLGYIIFISPIH